MSDPNKKIRTRQWFIVAAASVAVLGVVGAGSMMLDNKPRALKEKAKAVSLTVPGSVDDKDAWRANEGAKASDNDRRLKELEAHLKAQAEDQKKLRTELQDYKKTGVSSDAAPPAIRAPSTAGSGSGYAANEETASRLLERPIPVRADPSRVLESPNGPRRSPRLSPSRDVQGGQQQAGPTAVDPAGQQPEAVEMITFGSPGGSVPNAPSNKQAARGEKDGKEKSSQVSFLPAGSYVRVAMLNGVDAPTGGQAQSNSLPIAFHVLDVANLVNKFRMDIRDCRFIAAAWGDLSSERTKARTDSLTCIINGEAAEMAVKGTVIGEDGKEGIRGRLVTKQGQLLLNGLLAGGLSGVGRALQSSATTTTAGGGGITQTIDPDRVAQAGLGGGLSTSANMLAQYYIKAADKLFPVIETDGGRVVEILITKGAVLEGTPGAQKVRESLLQRGTQQRGTQDED